MLSTFRTLLGARFPVFMRYLRMALLYGVFSGLTMVLLAPTLGDLLAGNVRGASGWLLVMVAGVLLCWSWRRQVELAGMDVGVAVLQEGRKQLADHVVRLPVGWFTPDHTAQLGHLMSQGMMEIAQLPAHLITPMLAGVVTPGVMALALLWLQPLMGLIALAALPVMAAVFVLAFRRGQVSGRAFQQSSAQTSQRIIEFARAQSVLRAFGGEGASRRFLAQALARQHQAGAERLSAAGSSVVLNVLAVQAVFAALLVGAVLWLDIHAAAGLSSAQLIGLVVALLLVNRFIEPLLEVAGYADVLRTAWGQLDAVRDILATALLPQGDGRQIPHDASMRLRGVGFRYRDDQPEVLKDIDLDIAAGSMVALVGASGSGKTTVLRLLARFFDVTHGEVLLGGVNVKDLPADQLAASISQIFQESYLFQGNIVDNVRIGKPDASDTEVQEAVRLAGVTEIARRLPQGLDTPVGEGGVRLSGGERQRIAIARALIKDAPILLVDEATAALDADNQVAITQALNRLRGRRTLVVIAHQLSTVTMADEIVVLEEGRIVERGSDAQLRRLDGRYAHFIALRAAARGWRING